MDQPLPSIGRTTFTIHFIVALVIGVLLLLAPVWFGGLFGYPDEPGLRPVIRGFGAVILGFGGLTSFYGMRAPSWAHVDYVVRGEIAYLAIQTLVYVISALAGVGPALGNWLFAVVSVILLALFAATFAARPK